MEEDEAHSPEYGRLDPVDDGIAHLVVGGVAPPDEGVGRGEHGLGQAVVRLVERGDSNVADALLPEAAFDRRVDAAEGVARYEPMGPSGEHHHHIVCESCGEVATFEDSDLESAIERLARRSDFAIDAHDVTLRGECPTCRRG